uniref:Uncharacterized protein n=1 Tax=Romanomermis culicivorax TaxID=13658 RepID=A0A915L0C9_ROMCU
MWSSVWRNELERIEFLKWMGQDLMNNKISNQMEEVLQIYPKIRTQKSVRNLFYILLIKWIPRSLKEPKDEEQTNLRENAVYFLNCNFYNLFHFLNIHTASQNLIYWNVSASIFKAKDPWVPSQTMDHDKPEVVIIADPPITTMPPTGSEGIIQEEGLMEIVETEMEKQPEVEKLTEQIKEMKEKIEMLEKEKYGKAAIKLAKQLENANAEEEETSEKPIVEVVSEIASEEDENPQANVLPAPPVYAKAGGQNVENITNREKFAKVMQFKRQMKEKRIAQEENKAELEKVKTGNFQQPAANPNDRIKYRRGLGKRGQALNKALKEGKYIVDYQYGRAHAYVTMKLWREFNARQEGLGNNFHAMYASCQSRAAGLAYTIPKAVLEDKKDLERNYANIQVWKKETDNTDQCIQFGKLLVEKRPTIY